MVEGLGRPLEGRTFIDLFCGAGGFRLALESLGATCVMSSEIDWWANEVYHDNFGEWTMGDITELDFGIIPDCDIVCAGFPCQPFSIAGLRKGFDDARGDLFFWAAKIIELKKPKAVILENVKNFVSIGGGEVLGAVRSKMESLGYSFHWQVLNAANYGVPQKRERVFMVCLGDGGGYEFPSPFPLQRHIEDFLLQDADMTRNLFIDRDDITMYGIDEPYTDRVVPIGHIWKSHTGYRVYSLKGSMVTITASGGGVFGHAGGIMDGGKPRKLHQRECARLMGFPDSYRLCCLNGEAYRQMGNSVVVDVVQYVAANLRL